jgi:hypothetical protein
MMERKEESDRRGVAEEKSRELKKIEEKRRESDDAPAELPVDSRRRGRPLGAKNKPKDAVPTAPKRRGRPLGAKNKPKTAETAPVLAIAARKVTETIEPAVAAIAPPVVEKPAPAVGILGRVDSLLAAVGQIAAELESLREELNAEGAAVVESEAEPLQAVEPICVDKPEFVAARQALEADGVDDPTIGEVLERALSERAEAEPLVRVSIPASDFAGIETAFQYRQADAETPESVKIEKFFWNGIKVTGQKKLILGFVSFDRERNGSPAVTFFCRGYGRMPRIDGIAIRNHSDAQSDYFEEDHFTLNDGSPYWREALQAAKTGEQRAIARMERSKWPQDGGIREARAEIAAIDALLEPNVDAKETAPAKMPQVMLCQNDKADLDTLR